MIATIMQHIIILNEVEFLILKFHENWYTW